MFYKIYKDKSTFYLFNLIPEKMSSYRNKHLPMLRQMLIVFLSLKLNITFSKTLSSYLQLLNGTSLILPFGTLKVLVFSKAISSNLLDPPQEVFLTVTTTKELD